MSEDGTDMLGSGTGRAGGKAILLGEHAVVYGATAIAIPVPQLWVEVEVGPGSGWDMETPEGVDPDLLDRARDAQLAALGWPGRPPRIRIRANLPVSCGLGSSAALSVALARALLAASRGRGPAGRLIELANASELVFHERPSGVDVATILAEVPIRFRRGEIPRPLRVEGRFDLWVVDSGVRSLTAEVVSAVAARRRSAAAETDAAMARLAGAAETGADALERGDRASLGQAMAGAMEGLRAIDVSHPAIERVVEEAKIRGALAAKLSGAGRGGIVLLLAPGRRWTPGPDVAGCPVLTRITLT